MTAKNNRRKLSWIHFKESRQRYAFLPCFLLVQHLHIIRSFKYLQGFVSLFPFPHACIPLYVYVYVLKFQWIIPCTMIILVYTEVFTTPGSVKVARLFVSCQLVMETWFRQKMLSKPRGRRAQTTECLQAVHFSLPICAPVLQAITG